MTGAPVLVGSVLLTHARPSLLESDPDTARAELRCSACGYGAIISGMLPDCPMCQASTWEQLPWRAFAAGG